MSSRRYALVSTILAAVLCAVPSTAQATDGASGGMSVQPQPISTNPADSPVRTESGKVPASTDSNRPPALGVEPAKVVIVVFSDFQCPVCMRSADATRQIPEEFPGEVRVEFWQHALAMHANAENAAVASLAAQRQGKFWEYHDELFRHQNALDVASLNRYAQGAGLDADAFQRDYGAPELRARVKSEGAVADTFGAASTPAFMINGKVYVGWGSWVSFRGNVERELAEARKLEAGGVPLAQIAEQRAQTLLQKPELFEAYRDLVLPKPPPPSVKPKKGRKTSAGR